MVNLIVAIFIIACLLIGAIAARKVIADPEAFFLSRTLGRWSVGISAGATANTGFIVTGAVGMGYGIGISAILYPLAWLIGDLVFWYFFAKKINSATHKQKAISVIQIITGPNSARSLRLLSGFVIVLLLVVYASAQFTAAGKTAEGFYGFNQAYAMIGVLIVVLAYSAMGGFMSSVWTDLMQGLLMIVLTISLLILVFIGAGGVESAILKLNEIDPALLKLSGGRTLSAVLFFIMGYAFAGFGFSISQPQVTTRIMAGRDAVEVKNAKWIYIGFLHFTWIGMCLIGLGLRLVSPDIEDPEQALPIISTNGFHPIVAGGVLAGMLAAIFSSLDSLIVTASNTLSIDILGRNRLGPKNTYGRIERRVLMLLVGIIALLLSFYFSENVFQTCLFAATILSSSIGAVMVIKILNLKSTDNSLLWTIMVGFSVAIGWRISGLHNLLSDGLVGFSCALVANRVVVYFKLPKKEMK